MFSTSTEGVAYLLKSESSEIAIWPAKGAILNNWKLQLHNKEWQVVEGYDTAEDFDTNAEDKGFRSCKLSPYVCRMNNSTYGFDGKEYTIGKFVLAGNAIHGLLYNEPFEVEEHSADDKTAVLALKHSYNATDEGYPFSYEIKVRYVLEAANALTIITQVTNTGKKAMPLNDGWHPYFSLGKKVDDLQFVMDSDTMVEFDETLVPTGNLVGYNLFQEPEPIGDTQLDNCFVLREPLNDFACKLINTEDNLQLTIAANHGYPYLQVYIPPHRNSIAVENLSSAPNAFNNKMGLLILAAGETASFSCTYKVGAVE